MKTIYFVGMHNKEGMLPLDSRTRTGKLIDKIIAGVNVDCYKTNFSDTTFLPNDKDIEVIAEEWWSVWNPKKEDVIILLGAWVQKNFIHKNGFTICPVKHPAGIFGTAKRGKYVEQNILFIEQNLKFKTFVQPRVSGSVCEHKKTTDHASGIYKCYKCGILMEGEEFDDVPFAN